MKKNVLNTIKQLVVGIVLAGLVSLLPFYFETQAMTSANTITNNDQDLVINLIEEEIEILAREAAVEQSERKHNKEALIRIETKLDELIKEVKTLDN